MQDRTLHTDLISSLIQLATKLDFEHIPLKKREAIWAANPWYTEYYLSKSLEGISLWLSHEKLNHFLQSYSRFSAEPKRIGIITAGNLPLVGFHDILMGVLSGHSLFLKISHQDRPLMQWVLDRWQEHYPLLSEQIHICETLPEVDFLIATGSNNTARYLENQFRGIPSLVRKNRFSVAVADGRITDQELAGLAEDVLLYNGLGCRNVSTLFLKPDFPMNRWLEVLNHYAKDRLNPHYLEQLLREKVKMEMLGASFIDGGVLLMQVQNQLLQPPMGVLNLIYAEQDQLIRNWISANQHQIQCQVGVEVPFGMTQKPDIYDFADGVDTFLLLNSLEKSC